MSEPSNTKLSRRNFLQQAGIASAGVISAPLLAKSQPVQPVPPVETKRTFVPDGAQNVSLRVNGKKYDLQIEPRVTLLDCLRENIQLTGTKKGCDHGQCGACTVHVNGRRVTSCLSLAIAHQSDEITTIEGLGSIEKLHPMQDAFVKHDAFQCGYCTPGQIMSAVALLKEPCGRADADVKEAMSGNICRCGAYKNILAAIQEVRGQRAKA
jgi:Aerobic-type carbon monoxide dehydrogenase, small subunit CoxS/CutS homologs